MPGWGNSKRRDELPDNWYFLRIFVLERDHNVCQHLDANTIEIDPDTGKQTGTICGRKANQVDHINRGNDHDPKNLQALCEWHHKQKSSSEGGTAKAEKRAAAALKNKPKHPGYYN